MRAESREQLRVALEALVKTIGEKRRKRSPQEADSLLTDTYARLVVSASFARLGELVRAGQLLDDATTVFAVPARANNPVHQFLFAACAARTRDIIAGRARMQWVSPALHPMLQALDRVARMKVDRFREAVSPNEVIDAIGDFSMRRNTPPAPVADWESFESEPRATFAESLVELASDAAFDTLCAVLVTLPEELALPILVRVLPRLDARPAAAARALEVVAHFKWGELLERPLAAARVEIHPDGDPKIIAASYAPTIRALRRLGLRDDLADILERLAPFATAVARGRESLRMMLAGGWSFLGDARAHAILLEACAARKGETEALFVERLRLVARGYALASIATACNEGLVRLRGLWVSTTDSFGTNSHFTLLPIYLVANCCLVVDEIADD